MNIELDPRKASVLYIETANTATGKPDNSKFIISGKSDDVLFNLVALTSAICRELEIPTTDFAMGLPQLVDDYRRIKLQASTSLNMGQFLRRGGRP